MSESNVTPGVNMTRDFKWGVVPPQRGAGPVGAQEVMPPAPDLGPLAQFTGKFRGNGFNTIFRPQDFAVTPTSLPNPGTGPDDNVLELNITEETLEFSEPLGTVPNRGMVQKDIFLNGVPYLQKIQDVTDSTQPAVGIHFEPGVWLMVPNTDNPAEGPSFCRMASIPHGTTINAQGVSFSGDGPPKINPVDITPFPIGSTPPGGFKFPSQTAATPNTFRIPQDLTGTAITQDLLDNPNKLLSDRIAAQTITHTDTLVISTNPRSPLFGGGTANIAELKGGPGVPNADAIEMSAIFWIETVSQQITVPACTPGAPVTITGDTSAGNPVPSFLVDPPYEVTADLTIDVTFTQIQYTQTVMLNFNGLTWPHVSVANLVPETVTVPQSVFPPAPGT